MNQHQTKRQETAFHEAGHAVIAAVKGLQVVNISITPLNCSLGRCEVDQTSISKHNSSYFNFTAYLVAGRLAQEQYLNIIGATFDKDSLDRDCRDDHDAILAINAMISGNGCDEEVCLNDVTAHVKEVTVNVKKMLAMPDIWALIQQISDALLIENEMDTERILSFFMPFYKKYYQQ